MSNSHSEFRPDAISASDWRQIVQSATDTANITTNLAGLVTSWNEGAHRLLGWAEEEMLGQTLDRRYEPDRARIRGSPHPWPRWWHRGMAADRAWRTV